MIKSYPHLMDTSEYPDYTRRNFKVPTWETFKNRTQFCTLRSLHHSNWKQDIDLYVDKFKLGNVIWPMIYCLYSSELSLIIAELKERGLYMFDLWSYVPGSSMAGVWANITPPPGVVKHLREELGEYFLGMDNGEQDGRYVGQYAPLQCPSTSSRYNQYLNFHRHFARLGEDMDNHMSTLVSLCFGHYFLKEGNHALIGAETAQGLPNAQVYYSFIRGAGKQYGVGWFGNASVFNRWGWKTYDDVPYTDESSVGYKCGPEYGTSLRLLKRLIYTHILYNCKAVGFESSWLKKIANEGRYEDQWQLTPIGKMQASANEWIETNGQPGVMHTPVAFLLDFFAGWAVPRHLYTNKLYQVWGAMPYEQGDFLTHALLSLAYPGYEDSSYYHNEKGFLTATPFGDSVDCVLSDIPEWVLKQYPAVVAAGELDGSDSELRDKLQDYVYSGGQLALTAANARGGLVPGVEVTEFTEQFSAGTAIKWADGTTDYEDAPFVLCGLEYDNAKILAECKTLPAVVEVPYGKGKFVLLASEYGFGEFEEIPESTSEEFDKPLCQPYPFLKHAMRAFGNVMKSQQIFEVGDNLGFVTCLLSENEYILGIYNNELTVADINIRSMAGNIISIEELAVDGSETGLKGCWPTGCTGEDTTDASKISGGDIRIFKIKLEKPEITAMPRIAPPAKPKDIMLSLRGEDNIENQLLARPTFFQKFDGVKIDYTYLAKRSVQQLEREAGWIGMQKLRTIVDFSSGINFYPDLTFLDDYPPHYDRSRKIIDDVIDKMDIIGAESIILTLHKLQENRPRPAKAPKQFAEELRRISDKAGASTVYLQHHPYRSINPSLWRNAGESVRSLLAILAEADRDNLKLAINVGHLNPDLNDIAEIIDIMGGKLGMILLSSCTKDAFFQVYDSHTPISESGMDLSWIGRTGVPVVLDAVYGSKNQEYEDLKLIRQ